MRLLQNDQLVSKSFFLIVLFSHGFLVTFLISTDRLYLNVFQPAIAVNKRDGRLFSFSWSLQVDTFMQVQLSVHLDMSNLGSNSIYASQVAGQTVQTKSKKWQFANHWLNCGAALTDSISQSEGEGISPSVHMSLGRQSGSASNDAQSMC